jgi:sigma-E factor negative regulatory protein RseA
MNPEPSHSGANADASADSDPCHWLSALADGDSQAMDPACRLWRDDAEARRTWHTYHLIGDVMRSDELVSTPARDAAFLAGLRLKLAAEPVPLAPAPLRRRQAWLVPAAAAAGFVVVAGVLVLARGGPAGPAGPALASASVPGGAQMLAEADKLTPQGARAQTVLRDRRLDEYLRAHQQPVRHGMPVLAGEGGLRQVDVTVPAGPAR